MIVSEEAYLEHFGKKGMKWGVITEKKSTGRERAKKKEVPADKQAKREAKAQKYVKRAEAFDVRIKEIQAVKPTSKFKAHAQARDIKDLTKIRDKALVDAERKRQGKLSKGQRNMAIGTAVVATLLAGAAVKSGMESGAIRQNLVRGRQYIQGDFSNSFKVNPHLADKMDADKIMTDVVAHINPDYGAPGTKQNCRRATMAYEMRRRGYDVKATKTSNASGQNVAGLANVLDPGGPERKTGTMSLTRQILKEEGKSQKPIGDLMLKYREGMGEHNAGQHADTIFRSLATQPDGARGELGMLWKAGGGHSVSWEIINGQPHVFDNQSGQVYKTWMDMKKDLGESILNASYTRLDDKDLNTNYLLRWLQNA